MMPPGLVVIAVAGGLSTVVVMTIPPQATIGDLVPLMYRARWTWFSLSGEVRTRGSGSRSDTWQESGSIEIAPGSRYRAEVTDDDGERDLLACDGPGGSVPFASLMLPSLLLPDFDLRITGREEFLGRDVVAIAGSARLASPLPAERVTGLVDAELGILLRRQDVNPGQAVTAEFTSLTVGPSEPASPHSGPQDSSRSLPQQAPTLTGADVNLLYRSDLGPQRFSAELSEQADIVTMMRLARESFAATKFGSRIRWLWRPSDDGVLENVDRAMAASARLSPRLGALSSPSVLADQVEVFIDRALGVCLCQVGSYQEHPVLRAELTGLTTEVDQSLFDYEPPPGTKVITGGMFAEAGQSPAHVAIQAGKGAAALALEVGRRWLSRNDVAEPGS
jgi:hypothetical protein